MQPEQMYVAPHGDGVSHLELGDQSEKRVQISGEHQYVGVCGRSKSQRGRRKTRLLEEPTEEESRWRGS